MLEHSASIGEQCAKYFQQLKQHFFYHPELRSNQKTETAQWRPQKRPPKDYKLDNLAFKTIVECQTDIRTDLKIVVASGHVSRNQTHEPEIDSRIEATKTMVAAQRMSESPKIKWI